MFDDSSSRPSDGTPPPESPDDPPRESGQRAFDNVIATMLDTVIGRISPYVTLILLLVAAIVIGSYLAGLAALSGGIRTVWAVLAAVFGFLAIRGLVRLRWNLAVIRRHRSDLVSELVDLRRDDPDAESVVIDMVETTESGDVRYTRAGYSNASGDFVRIGRNLEGFVGAGSPWLMRLVSTAKRGLLSVVTGVAITLVFAFMGLIFLIALAI